MLAQWYKDLRADERMDNTMTDEAVQSQMESFLNGKIYKTYFLEVNGVAVGYGMLDVTREPKYLRHLFIHRDYRRKGYGRMLINLLMEIFDSKAIDIEVMVWNENAIQFYNSLGFKPRYYGMRLNRDLM